MVIAFLAPLLMRRLLLTGVAVIAASAIPTAAFAASSGTVSASTTVGYSCDITFPGNQALTVDGADATASAALPYTQNGDTDYSLSSLSITAPGGANMSGVITITDKSSSTLVTNNSTLSSATGSTNPGIDAGTGGVAFSLSEDTAAAFLEGSYSISATLSCSEAN